MLHKKFKEIVSFTAKLLIHVNLSTCSQDIYEEKTKQEISLFKKKIKMWKTLNYQQVTAE